MYLSCASDTVRNTKARNEETFDKLNNMEQRLYSEMVRYHLTTILVNSTFHLLLVTFNPVTVVQIYAATGSAFEVSGLYWSKKLRE